MQFRIVCCLLMIVFTCSCHTKQETIKYPEGGYAYLENVSSSDSDYYFLPIRKLIPRKDSMVYANVTYYFRSFDEPNLSIEPPKQDRFRLSIEGFAATSTIISITKDSLIIKQQKKGNNVSVYPDENIEQLTHAEKEHYYFLSKFFPYGKRKYVTGKQLYIDSMIKVYPRLLDQKYYQYLLDKIIDKNATQFRYATKKILLTDSTFTSIITLINASSYWKLPYRPLVEAGMDGWGFCLEANTKEKYNAVFCSGIGENPDLDKLKQACQQILDHAQINPDFEIWNSKREE